MRQVRFEISGWSSSSRRLGGRSRDASWEPAEQLGHLVRPRVERQDDEAQVELAALDQRDQVAVVGGLLERDIDLRPSGGELPQQLGQDAGADALVGPDPQRAGVAGVERCKVGLCRLQPCGDRVGVAEHEVARLRQRHRAWATRAVDQAPPDDPLEHRDLLTDRGLGVSEALRGAAEGSLLGDRLQGDQVPQFQTEPGIRRHNEYNRLRDWC